MAAVGSCLVGGHGSRHCMSLVREGLVRTGLVRTGLVTKMLGKMVLPNFCVPLGPRFGGARGAAGAPAARKN